MQKEEGKQGGREAGWKEEERLYQRPESKIETRQRERKKRKEQKRMKKNIQYQCFFNAFNT